MAHKFDRIFKLSGGKPVAVFGAGASGEAACALLKKAGLGSAIYAQNSDEKWREDCGAKHALAVYSPAFRPDNEWIVSAQKHGCQCLCEPDFAALAWRGKTVAITGTNGKTTLTKFITHALRKVGIEAVSAGNIGIPLSKICAECDYGEDAVAVCELSSFQTSRIKYLAPDALVWTNFDADHLDWHKDLREYFSAKVNLALALKKGGAFIAGESVEKSALAFGIKLPENAVFFGEDNPPPAPAPFDTSIQARNFTAARLLWEKLGLDEQTLLEACADFELPKFRFSTPEQFEGVRFYNDSKATNVHAALAALDELKNSENLVWLGGGKDKNCDLSELADRVAKYATAAVLIGQTAAKLEKLFDARKVAHFTMPDMQSAVAKCFELAKANAEKTGADGDVLFSPAFSSFGMFAGYADRGKSFQNAVLCLKNSKKK